MPGRSTTTLAAQAQLRTSNPAGQLAGPDAYQHLSFVASLAPAEPLANSVQQLIANHPIGFQALLAAASGVGRIGGGPIFHVDRAGPGEFESTMMRLRR